MNVTLTKDLEKFVSSKVRRGRYASASEVVREALRALQREENHDCRQESDSSDRRDHNRVHLASCAAGHLEIENQIWQSKGSLSAALISLPGSRSKNGKRPAGRTGLEEAGKEIEGRLRREKQEKRFKQWMKEIRSRTKFEVNYQALEQ